MRLQSSTLTLALAACAGVPAFGQTCTPTAVTPYISIDGRWTKTDAAVVSAGNQVALGPQPISGGAWSWSGCGTAGNGREQTWGASATCTAIATFTNDCGAKSQQRFTLSVPVVPRDLSVQEGSTAVLIRPSLSLAAGRSASWSLAGTDAVRFTIDAATGALAFREGPDTASSGDADGHNDCNRREDLIQDGPSWFRPVPLLALAINHGGFIVTIGKTAKSATD